MGRNNDVSLRGKVVELAGFAFSPGNERTVVESPDVMTDGDSMVSVKLTVAGASSITLPAGCGVGTTFLIRDGKGDASSNNITISAPSGETIHGAGTLVLAVNYSAVWLRKDSSTTWVIMARNIPSANTSSGVTFTQTYSTADATVPAVTSHAITDSSGGTASTSAIASITTGGGTYPDATPVKNAIATLAAELALTKADQLQDRKLINKLIDALQAAGIAS